MVFRRASVGGQMYVDDEPEATPQVIGKSLNPPSTSRDVRPPSSDPGAGTPQEMANSVEAEGIQLSGGILRHFRSFQLARKIEAAAADSRSSDRDRHGKYWTTLALCHTVITGVNPRSGLLEYKAQSPDEAALVQAAADVGFEFRGRDRDVLTLRTPFAHQILRFRLLNIL